MQRNLLLLLFSLLFSLTVATPREEVEVTASGGRRRKLKRRKGKSNGSNRLPSMDDGSIESSIYLRDKEMSTSTQARYTLMQTRALRQLERESKGKFPSMDSHYRITNKQRKQFHEKGYVLLRGLASPEEVAFFRGALNRVINMDVHWLTKRPGFIRVYNLWDKSDMARAFILNKRFGQAVSDLLQVDGVRLYQDQAFHKMVGDTQSPLHQDNYAAPLDTNLTAGLWVPLVPVTKEMGALEFYPGSHLDGQRGQGFHFDESVLDSEFGPRETPGATGMQPGDVTVHTGWTIHRANANKASTAREAIVIQYFADGTVRNRMETQHGSYRHDANSMSRWADDIRPGQIIDSEFTPLVFSY